MDAAGVVEAGPGSANITEDVASMTDTYAIDTYRLLKGISLPNYAP